MGFSVSGSFAILVLASFIAFGMLYSAGASGFERVTEATGATYDNELGQQNTAIEITNATHNGTHLIVNVSNGGSTALSINDTDLIVDGTYQSLSRSEVGIVDQSDSELWLPGETLQFTISMDSAPERAKVVTEHGVADAGVVS